MTTDRCLTHIRDAVHSAAAKVLEHITQEQRVTLRHIHFSPTGRLSKIGTDTTVTVMQMVEQLIPHDRHDLTTCFPTHWHAFKVPYLSHTFTFPDSEVQKW